MDEIIKNVTSVGWWFSVVIVGLIVSVVATYTKSAIDFTAKYALNTLVSFKKRNEESTRRAIEKLNSDSDFRDFIFQAELRTYISAFMYVISGVLGFAAFVMIIYLPELQSLRHTAKFVGLLSVLILFLGCSKFFDAAYLGRGLILAAKERFKLDEL